MAEWLENGACEACGSSDACASYSDGSTYCFSCGAVTHDGVAKQVIQAPDLLRVAYQDLTKRRITEQTCRLWGYGLATCNNQLVQVAQFRSKGNQVVAQKLRGANKEFQWLGDKDQASPLFGQHLWAPNPKKKLVITEGELDALSVSQAQQNKWPVVSVPDGAKSAKKAVAKALDYVTGFKEVVIFFDQDGPGQEAALEVADLLPPGTAKIATISENDASDLLQKGRGDEIIRAIFEAETYRPDSILGGDELVDYLFMDMPESGRYFCDSLTEKLRGIRKREITMITAGSGIGKTTFCQEQSYSLIEQGYKVGFVYLEQGVQITLLNLLGIPLNRRLKLMDDLPREEVLRELKKIQDRICVYNHFGTKDPDRLISELRYMIQAEGCDFIVFDHISIVISGMKTSNERQEIDYMMTSLRTLVEETGAGIILVSHLKRPSGDKGFSSGKVPSMEDLRGSASLEQLSDVIIGASRSLDSGDTTVGLNVLKDRWQGNTGPAGSLEFDKDTGRLKQETMGFQEAY